MAKLIDKLTPEGQLDEDLALGRAQAEQRATEAKYKAALREIETLRERCDRLAGLKDRPPEKPGRRPKRAKAASGTAVLVLSDWHVEERVDPATVNGQNEFDVAIAEKSVEQTTDKALMLLEDARHLAHIDRLVVALLGDFISGHIHDELIETNQMAPLPATRFAGKLLERSLRTLLAHADVAQMDVVTCHGNHGRTSRKMRHANSADMSYEYDLYLDLARRFDGEERVRWQIGTGYHNWLEVEGHPVRFHHGDSIRYQGGVGGLSIPVNKAIAAWNKTRPAAFDFFGHFHTWTRDWTWLCNGSLIGYNAFALSIKASYQPPVQTFAVFDAERGCTRTLAIYCR